MPHGDGFRSVNPGHLEVGYQPRAPSSSKARCCEPNKGRPFSRELWLERSLNMRDQWQRRAHQSLAHKDPGASNKLNTGCSSFALLRKSKTNGWSPNSSGGQYVDFHYKTDRQRDSLGQTTFFTSQMLGPFNPMQKPFGPYFSR